MRLPKFAPQTQALLQIEGRTLGRLRRHRRRNPDQGYEHEQ
jgi:hypothetical protein